MELENRENVFTVSEVTAHLKNIVENYMPIVYVEGEISNFTRHSSGHMYFSIKDENASMRCVFFRNYQFHVSFNPQDGYKVICLGKISIYEKGGQYQLNVQNMMQSGKGDLQQQFEELKKKLASQGLFDPAHKQQIPAYSERVGIVTSPTGAAFQDIKNILTRRYPCQAFLYPATVQGESAAREVMEGIRYFNEVFPVDVMIIGRGGGSQEDLFCFNDEQLANAIYESRVPIISAVGHEIDFTISDFVADLRAPTPSAAAELAVPDKQDVLLHIHQLGRQMKVECSHTIKNMRLGLSEMDKELHHYHPKYVWQTIQQRFDEAVIRLHNCTSVVQKKRDEIIHTKQALQISMQRNIEFLIRPSHITLKELGLKLKHQVGNRVSEGKNQIENLHSRLTELSPFEALKRGYALINLERKLLHSVDQVVINDQISVRLQDGVMGCEVRNIEKNGTFRQSKEKSNKE